MATHAPMARVPFAPLDNSRLQHLASAKNRQNGIFMQKHASEAKSSSNSIFHSSKRPLEPSTFDDVDSENIDPAAFYSPSKKCKNDFTFSISPSKSMPPPPTLPPRLSTPIRANMSSPRAPLTAPAGRSPKRKASGLQKTRRISAPFSRIDPPFSSSRTNNGLPFSLDAALSGTFAKPASAGATIQESMPKNWFFDIYEDSPEEEAAILMEHSTLTLDLSSDEESSRKAMDDRGKENTPPEGYDAPTASRPAAEPTATPPARVKKTDIVRKRIIAEDAMDDGQRSPLSDLETEYFIPDGLSKDSHVVVHPTPENPSTSSAPKSDMSGLFAAPVQFTSGFKKSGSSTPSKSLFDMPIVNADGDVKGDIIVWEDSPSSTRSSLKDDQGCRLLESGKGEDNENTQPQVIAS